MSMLATISQTESYHGRSVLREISLLLLVLFVPTGVAANQQQAALPAEHRKILETHCFDCHDSATQEGSVDLQGLSPVISLDLQTAETWHKVLGAINSGEMPPEDAEPLRDADKSALLKDLSEQMVVARKLLSDSGGRATLRRLNRREYANTIEALLGIRPDVTDLPDDQTVAGFDTQGASLFMSSDQIEQYLASSRAALELAFLPSKPSKSKTIRVEPETQYTPHYQAALAEMVDREKRAAAYFAQDQKKPADFGFLDEYEVKKQRKQEWRPLLEDYLARPETKTGATLIMTIKQGGYTKVKLPTLQPQQPGNYVIRVRAAAYPEAEERMHYLEFSTGFGTNRTRLGWRKVSGTLENPQTIEFPITHRPGERQQIWIHQRSHQDRGDKNLAQHHLWENGKGTVPGLWIDWAELMGPQEREGIASPVTGMLKNRQQNLTDDQHARQILKQFATQAFRGKSPDAGYLDRLHEHYLKERSKGMGMAEALIQPFSIVLSSPSFLYMVQTASAEDSANLNGHELATRLSYFLWSSPPDEQLLQAAANDGLRDAKILQEQTDRLLSDPRSDEFIEGFVHQWLQMDRLDMFQFNGVQYPTFDNAARESAREEIFSTVRHVMNKKLPLQTLLDADFVVINDLLAGYYGIPEVQGSEFRAVKVPSNSPRGGLMGTAAVLAMGSDGERSSPVERGVWVLRHLLNDPPPPAPANVPQLSRLADKVLPARRLAEAHQEQPQCANCHQKIDPIGYALENFDAAGLWREEEVIGLGRRKFGKWTKTKSFPIDPSGQLVNGQSFSDYAELQQIVANRSDAFAQGFTEALATYALGRSYSFTDEAMAKEILLHAEANQYSIESFIHALVQTETFQGK